MISEASGRKTLLHPPSPPAEATTYLAPGFRFHPTDEELISYYLKRKITGRPIKADAISEIDLYKAEPWDLPPRSRLRSRDLEWYFFTSLDRKYSNRCRTNRATAEGYWKTTGKDRPIQNRSRNIGMKKTLVYHTGRAPRGQRTNWVMHEYRLDDEELARSGISQDCYVLCRVFQKNGSGPQNGAQYGAPFIEEEWEREEEGDIKPVHVNVDLDALMDPAGHDFVQLGDFVQDPDSGIQHPDSFPFEATSDDQTQGSSNFAEGVLKDQDSLDDMPQEEDFSASHDNNISFMLGEKNVLEDQLNYASMHKGYVQLKDMFSLDDMNCSPKAYANHCLLEGDSVNNNGNANQLDQLQMCPAIQNEVFPQSFDHSGDGPWEYPSGQLAEDNLVYYDAISNEIPYSEDGFAHETSLTPLAEFDFLEDLMSFYDTTNDSLINDPPIQFLSQSNTHNSSEWVQSNTSPEVVGRSTLSSKEVFNVPDCLAKMPSLVRTSSGDGPSTGYNDSMTKDAKPEAYEDKTLTKRLASMLHSISAPPAFADESGLIGKTAAQIPAASGSALHITAGMIQIDNWTSLGYTGSWTLQKRAELGFFSYGMDGSMVSKSASHDPRNKVLSGIYSAFCRNTFPLFVLSAVMLAFSYKIGIYVCQL